MLKQFLLNQDGTVPPGVDLEVLTAEGIKLVIPSTPGIPSPGYKWVEKPAKETENGTWVQVWEEEPAVSQTVIEDYKVLRKEAYKEESDHVFFLEQRGEVPPGTWISLVDSIKQRYPKP